MSTWIRVETKPVNTIITKLGVGRNGDVQLVVTLAVNQRIGRYMPHLSGVLETKLKHITGDAEITVLGPYARYQYYGKAMEGLAPMTVTDRDLHYTQTFNPLAGPFWDRRLIASEGKQIAADVQTYVKRKEVKR